MISSAFQSLSSGLAAATTAAGNVGVHFEDFRYACAANNWDSAEKARTCIIAAMESYLDEMAALHRRLADLGNG